MAVLVRARWVCIVCAAALCGALAGCVPDVVDVKAECPPAACDPTLVNPNVLYARAIIANSQFILAFTVDPDTGALTPAGAPVAAASDGSAGNLQQLSVSPDGRFLFALKPNNPASIEAFAIQAAGALVLVASNEMAASSFQRFEVALDMGHVYTSDSISPRLTQFALGGDGVLTASGSTVVPVGVGMSVHPEGRFIFSTVGSAINVAEGLPGGGIQDAGVGISLGVGSSSDTAVDPLGDFVVGFANATPPKIGLLRFTADPTLTLLNPPVADLPCGGSGATGKFHPTGQFIYVVCPGASPIVRLEGRDTTPVLTPITQFSYPPLVAQTLHGIAIPRSGKFLYRAAEGRTVIDGFSIDPTTGILSPLPDSPFDMTGFADFQILSGPLAAY